MLPKLDGGSALLAQDSGSQSPGHRPVQPSANPASPQACAGDVMQAVWFAIQDRLRRADSAADSRSDALSHVPCRKPCGVTGDEGVLAADNVHPTSQEIAVACGLIVSTRRQRAIQHTDEPVPVALDIVAAGFHALGHPPDTDI